MKTICTSCGKATLSPVIKSRPFLIIKEAVTENDLTDDMVFTLSGKNKYGKEAYTSAYYFNRELGLVGLGLNNFSLSALYLHHPPSRKKTKDERAVILGCVDYSVAQVMALVRETDAKIILLMGAEIVKTFTGYNCTDVYGLTVQSDLLPSVPVIVPAPNPDKIMNQPIGELRNVLKVFAEQIKIYNEYSKV